MIVGHAVPSLLQALEAWVQARRTLQTCPPEEFFRRYHELRDAQRRLFEVSNEAVQ